ncbi:MAG: SHOCT domain-containing protein [Pelolinea sp.]|nr:SHOCT domain-containing protein [Pelolinea sp.]
MMGYGWFGSCCGNGLGNMWIVGLISIILTFISVYLLFKLFSRGRNPQNASTAREILNVRFAKGEISKKEYEQMKKDLDN